MTESFDVSIDLDKAFETAVEDAASAVDGLASSVDGVTKKAGGLSAAERDVNDLARGMDDVADSSSEAADGLGDVGGQGAVMGAVAGAVDAVVTKLIEMGVEAAKAFAAFAAETIVGQREAENLFAAMTKGQGDFDALRKTAEAMGMSVEALTADMHAFSQIEGVNPNAALSMSKLKADLEALMGVEGAAPVIDKVTKAIESGVAPADAMAAAVKELGPAFAGVGDGSAAAAKASTTLDGALNKLKSTAANALAKGFEDAAPSIDRLVELMNELAESGDVGDAMSAIVDALAAVADAIVFVSENWATFKAVLGGIVGVVAPVVDAISRISAVVDTVGPAVSKAASAIKSKVGEWVGAAGDLVQGFIDGIKAKISEVVNAAGEMASSAVNAVKAKLKISSPSKVFADMGGNVSEGFQQGIKPVDVGAELVPKLPAANDMTPAAAPGGGASITINIDGAGSPADVAAAVREELDSYFSGRAIAGVA